MSPQACMWVAAWYATMSLATFAAFGLDKRRARRGTRRLSEDSLHLLELLGGWPGALVAQRLFHHKSRKLSYLLVLGVIVILHGVGWAIWAAKGSP
jgi:uncharacterized membrane protein YsdA (DUF1294 family)